jgi:hypothetical protein
LDAFKMRAMREGLVLTARDLAEWAGTSPGTGRTVRRWEPGVVEVRPGRGDSYGKPRLRHVCKVIGFGYGRGPQKTQHGEERMTEPSAQPKDKNYNLIAVLYQSSDNVESLKTYVQDAQSEGDQELIEFFGAVFENNLTAAQRAKEMLVPRLQTEQE